MRIGIDFGTCFSRAALMMEGRLTLIKSPDGQGYALPSSVYLQPNGEILVGQAADRQRAREPGCYKREVKRDLETSPFMLGGRSLRPEYLVAVVLGKLKEEADRLLPEPLMAALLTVPATFLYHQRGLMVQAAQAAGFQEVELLAEPVAAAIACDHQSGIREGEVVLIYDLGGGTFNTAVLRKQTGGFTFLGLPAGERCGGTDFDRAIYNDLHSRCSPGLRDLLSFFRQDVPALLARNVVLEQCIDLKHQLSQVQEAEVPLIVPGMGSVEYYQLSRQAFEQMIAPDLEKTLECCRRVVKSAWVQWEQVDRILLVGGSCRIPYVRERLEQAFGRPVRCPADPELAVCEGAALFAAQREERERWPVVAPILSGEYYTTIGEALRQARPGLPIKVRPGVYDESLVLDRPVELVGDGPPEEIILEATNAPCLVMQTEQATVRGLTLRRRGGVTQQDSKDECAVFVSQGQGVLEDCDISARKKFCLVIGGPEAHPTLRRCKLHDGEIGLLVHKNGRGVLEDSDIFNAGIGVVISERGNPILRRCKLHDASLFVMENGQGVLEDCDIFGNARGVKITQGGNPTLRRCKIHDGEVGVFVMENGQGVLEDCDIFDFTSPGVAITQGGNPTLRRCKLHDGEQNGLSVYENGRGVLEDCDIFGFTWPGVGSTQGGNPTLRRCKIHDGKGAGLRFFQNGQGVLEDCDVFRNALAGVGIEEGGNPTLRRCKLYDGEGVGLGVSGNGQGVLEDCDIFGNAWTGVGIAQGGNPTLRRCKIHDGKGAGLVVSGNGQGVLEDCDIFRNADGGVRITQGGNPTIRHSRIHDNQYHGIYVHDGGRGTIEACIVVHNALRDWSIDASSQVRRF